MGVPSHLSRKNQGLRQGGRRKIPCGGSALRILNPVEKVYSLSNHPAPCDALIARECCQFSGSRLNQLPSQSTRLEELSHFVEISDALPTKGQKHRSMSIAYPVENGGSFQGFRLIFDQSQMAKGTRLMFLIVGTRLHRSLTFSHPRGFQ